MLRTTKKYHDKLFGMRPNIYIGGEKVGRDDQPGINLMDITFNLAQDPKYKDLATAVSSLIDQEVNRWAHLPANPNDLMQKQL